MIKRSIKTGLIAFLFLFLPGFDIPPASINLIALNEYLATLKSDKDLQAATWSFALRDVGTKHLLASYQPDKQLIPASLMKIVSSGEALRLLGPDRSFTTQLAYSGMIDKQGVLHGDLYLIGGGDPTFCSIRASGFSNWPEKNLMLAVMEVQKVGIKRIAGNVIGDASVFDDNLSPGSWAFEDMGNYYGAAASGLTFADNSYTIHLSSRKEGSLCRLISTDPEIPGLRLRNEVLAGPAGSGDQAYVHGAPLSNLQTIRGTIPANRSDFVIKGAMPDPPLLAASGLYQLLEQNGIPVSGQAGANYVLLQESLTLIHTYHSPKLKDIVRMTNHQSNNLFAEHLLKQIGLVKLSEGSTASGIQAIRDDLKSTPADATRLWMEDGSGLSRSNTLSANFLTTYLNLLYQSDVKDVFWNSLPVAGQSGTLKYLMKNTPGEGHVFAKSGNLNRVRSYSGYVNARSGKVYSFCVIANNYNCSSRTIRSKWVKLMILISEL